MSKILYAWEWGTGAGHLKRLSPVVDALAANGHCLTLAVRDLSYARRFFPSPAVRLLQAPVHFGPVADPCPDPCGFACIAWNLGLDDPLRTRAFVEVWHSIFEGCAPDVVISDFGMLAAAIADRCGIPVVRMGTGFECPRTDTPPLFRHHAGSHDCLRRESNCASQIVDSANRAIGIFGMKPYASFEELCGSSSECYLATVPELDPYERPLEAVYHGEIGWKASPDHCAEATERRCFAYLKSFPLLQPVLGELLSRGMAVTLVPDGIPTPQLKSLADMGVDISGGHLDLAAAGKTFALAVTNGNHGTSLRMLSLGIPVLACPIFLEQRLSAAAIERHSLGMAVDFRERPHAGLLKNKIERFSDDTLLRHRAEQFASHYRASYEPERPVAQLLAAVEDRRNA